MDLNVSNIKKIHLIAICGVGMTALAGLLKAAGYEVGGSDAEIFPPMSVLLERMGISCKLGYDPHNIEPDVDLIIIGNAVRKDHPEVIATLARGIPSLSMPAALSAFFLEGRKSVVVAGTHGKTTTTALLSWLLTVAGLDPGMMVGGWAKNFDASYRLGGRASDFVIEGDEYDTAFFDKGPKFLHYRPNHAILTCVEYDHGDIYPDLPSLKAAFHQFVRLIPREGMLLIGRDLHFETLREITQDTECRVESYGLTPGADWFAENISQQGGRMTFEVRYGCKKIGALVSPLIGRHNLQNTLAAVAMASSLGAPWDAIAEGVLSFEGVKRRQETVGIARNIRIIDDFAHHPTAIAETLDAMRAHYRPRRLWAVFEPRSASSRRNIFQKEFVTALSRADRVVLANVFAAEKLPPEIRLNPMQIVTDLIALGKPAAWIGTADEIVAHLSTQLEPDDVVCIMSSGGFDGIHAKLLAAL